MEINIKNCRLIKNKIKHLHGKSMQLLALEKKPLTIFKVRELCVKMKIDIDNILMILNGLENKKEINRECSAWELAYNEAWKIQDEKYKDVCICGRPCSGFYGKHKFSCKRFETSVRSKADRIFKKNMFQK